MEVEDMIGGILDGHRVFTVLLGVIGLLVALVAVSNVTYVVVEERTREIGVLIALGARPRDAAVAKAAESLVITLTGGSIGVAAGAGLLWVLNLAEPGTEVRAYLGYPAVSWPLAGLILGLLAIGGCLAGRFPARRAAALDPVEALRPDATRHRCAERGAADGLLHRIPEAMHRAARLATSSTSRSQVAAVDWLVRIGDRPPRKTCGFWPVPTR